MTVHVVALCHIGFDVFERKLRVLGFELFEAAKRTGVDGGGEEDLHIGLRQDSRPDVTAVKAFLTTLNDHIRPVYERRVTRRPRQVVMAGSTNQSRYLRDLTGNRRFWPMLVGDVVDVVKLAEWRDQLFAEALHDVEAGERWEFFWISIRFGIAIEVLIFENSTRSR